jgi:hypothetical protein
LAKAEKVEKVWQMLRKYTKVVVVIRQQHFALFDSILVLGGGGGLKSSQAQHCRCQKTNREHQNSLFLTGNLEREKIFDILGLILT